MANPPPPPRPRRSVIRTSLGGSSRLCRGERRRQAGLNDDSTMSPNARRETTAAGRHRADLPANPLLGDPGTRSGNVDRHRCIAISESCLKRRLSGQRSYFGMFCVVILSLIPVSLGQTTAPSEGPLETNMPSAMPSRTPIPTTDVPSLVPSVTPGPSSFPSDPPSMQPSISVSPSSVAPSLPPSIAPSSFPTSTWKPSYAPSSTWAPTISPSESPAPTPTPTEFPSVTPMPTLEPTDLPSQFPSTLPSSSPSAPPSFNSSISVNQLFQQTFAIGNDSVLNLTEQSLFQDVMASYTIYYGNAGAVERGQISTSCDIDAQRLQIVERRKMRWSHRRRLQAETRNQIDYFMMYKSDFINVTDYPRLFAAYINENLDNVTADLQERGLNITESLEVIRLVPTPPPSASPSLSVHPSMMPSREPSLSPTSVPSSTFSPSEAPSTTPSTPMPTLAPTQIQGDTDDGLNTTVVAVASIAGVSAVLVALFVFYQYRRRKQELAYQARAASASRGDSGQGLPDQQSQGKMGVDMGQQAMSDVEGGAVAKLSPSDSIRSNQSLLSPITSMEGVESGDEADGTEHLADEFDQYKDQDLERMRNEVEGNVTGVDGMMSQALTKALMDDDTGPVDMYELTWGGTGDYNEIEASALCEVHDWLKRKEGASAEERRTFMQELLNRMVGSVRHAVMAPEDASRTVHECAALLGLPLANELAENSVIVIGMRKTVKSKDLERAFREFGEIDGAAIASNARGFGLVRFKTPKSVQRAMSKFSRDEIVVQDVAVMIKVLKADISERSESPFGFPPGQPISRHSSRDSSPNPPVPSRPIVREAS